MSTYTRDHRRRASDDYYDDSVYDNTRRNVQSTAVIKRRDSSEYDEDYRREYSPNGGYYRETTIRKSGTRPAGRSRSYENDRYEDDRSFASSRRDSYYGAAARRPRYDDRRSSGRSRYDRYSDDYSSRSRSRTPPKRERRKSMPEQALEALGLGTVAAKFMGKSRSKSRSRSSSRSRRSRSRAGGRGRDSSEHRKEQMQQALKAAIIAGAGAAFSARKEQGGWTGDKGKRVLTAALVAGGVDGFINRDKDPEKHKFRDTVGSAVAGIATDKLVNGRSRSRGPESRRNSPDRGDGRSRSRASDLLAAGGLAAAAKKIADNVRGRSQSRGRGRAGSADSYDSRSPPKRSRSRSVVARGLSKIGLNAQADKIDPAGARARSRSRGPRSRSRSRYVDDDYVDDRHPYDPPNTFNGRGGSVYDNREVGTSHPYSRPRDFDPHSGAMINRPASTGPLTGVPSPPPAGYHYDTAPHHNGDPETDSDTDLGHSSDDEKAKNKGRKRLAITGGLATVATIHAGHSVYQSMEKREARKRALKDGTISKEEAAKHKTRDRLQDAASVGLAALGIKGAYSEWKEMKENMEEHNKEVEDRKRHSFKREMRRRKSEMVGMSEPVYSNSAPTLNSDPYYHHPDGPYMSGANAESVNPSFLYQDDNPYSSFNQQPQQAHYQNNQFSNGQYGYPTPPVQGGTGYPPPPGSQPPPPQGY